MKASDLYGRPWSERECIVVLDAYFREKSKPRHSGASHIRQLARLLGRTPASIVMRTENFASLDPEVNASRKGLTHVHSLCKRVFDEWVTQQSALRACAQVFAREIKESRVPTLFEPEPGAMPKAFGRYELLDEIGKGGFGTVFSCVNTESQEAYAVKIIRADFAQNRECIARFSREIRALKAVTHTHIIRIHEDNLGTEEHFPAYVMDLARCNLDEYIAAHEGERPVLPLDQRCKILDALFGATEILHAARPQLIHRDITPRNVLQLPQGDWVLADFSLSKFLGSQMTRETYQTSAQKGWGTAYYAAPEQLRDFAKADERADVYALGRIMWDLFSKFSPPPRPEKDQHGLPQILAPVYARATAYDPNERYRSVRCLHKDFDEAVSTLQGN